MDSDTDCVVCTARKNGLVVLGCVVNNRDRRVS